MQKKQNKLNKETKNSKESKDSKEMSFFKKITAGTYLLVFFALLMPFATVSCSGSNISKKVETNEAQKNTEGSETSDIVLLDPSIYNLIAGVNIEEELKENPAIDFQRFENSGFLAAIKGRSPNYPQLPGMNFLVAILVGILITAFFALISPLGSITIGMISLIALWGALAKMGEQIMSVGLPILKVEPGIGIYAATFVIFFGTAMNLATIIRPLVIAYKAKKTQKEITTP